MSAFARVLGLLLITAILGTATDAFSAQRYRDDVIILKLKPEATAKIGAAITAATGIASLDDLHVQFKASGMRRTLPGTSAFKSSAGDPFGLTRYYTVELSPGTDIEAAVAAYAADPNVEIAEPDYIMPLHVVPNDGDFDEQWYHQFVTDKDIDTDLGWDLEVGDSTVIIAIIDSGFLYSHPDLVDATWVNPGEDLDGDGVVWDADDMNGIDDDLNGYIDDVVGYDFMGFNPNCNVLEDCNGQDNDPVDFDGHGTNVGGIAAATTGNGIGGAGVAGGMRSEHRPGAKLMGLRAGYQDTEGDGFVVMSSAAEAINYAVANGAFIFNSSWGSSGSLIANTVMNALANGLILTNSAGNDNDSNPDTLAQVPGVITVAALDFVGGKASFSDFGTWVDISAPGNNIYNTNGAGGSPGYASYSGTSQAAPVVAGVAALLKSHHPWLTRFDIDTIMQNTADDVDTDNPAFAGLLGAGRVNAFSALQGLTTADFTADVTFGDAPLDVNFTNASPNAPSGPYEYTFGDGGNAMTANASHTYNDPGIYNVTFTGSGPTGPHTRNRPEMIVVLQDTIQYGDINLEPGQTGDVTVRINNSHPLRSLILPVNLTGPSNIRINSLTGTALLSGWTIHKSFDNTFFGQGVWSLSAGTSGEPIPAGGGIIANIEVDVVASIGGAVEVVDTATLAGFDLEAGSRWVTFQPHFVPGAITNPLPSCTCPCHADPECDAVTNVLDVVKTVNVAFKGQPATTDPGCPNEQTDVNCDGVTNVIDVVKMVNVAFKGGSAATEFCDPCAP